MDMSLGKLREMLKERGDCHAAAQGSHKELFMTEWLNNNNKAAKKKHKEMQYWHQQK